MWMPAPSLFKYHLRHRLWAGYYINAEEITHTEYLRSLKMHVDDVNPVDDTAMMHLSFGGDLELPRYVTLRRYSEERNLSIHGLRSSPVVHSHDCFFIARDKWSTVLSKQLDKMRQALKLPYLTQDKYIFRLCYVKSSWVVFLGTFRKFTLTLPVRLELDRNTVPASSPPSSACYYIERDIPEMDGVSILITHLFLGHQGRLSLWSLSLGSPRYSSIVELPPLALKNSAGKCWFFRAREERDVVTVAAALSRAATIFQLDGIELNDIRLCPHVTPSGVQWKLKIFQPPRSIPLVEGRDFPPPPKALLDRSSRQM
ncbi:hypothetical protein FOZ63_025610 [Perkinsus olseni]|uniref:Uncharacterized protein n=1 Tax=Perkinsus olseni TaxID=32597 RepID=A0A7J6PQG2_PEROL|nr:hypothetical protein FOZ62_024957 [Perkinsus olseni]KAF4702413.1 hypothetical protein FOZ63_025610 [Perkinsus olseni]